MHGLANAKLSHSLFHAFVRAKLAKARLYPFRPSEGLPHLQSLLQKAMLDVTNAEYSTWVFQISLIHCRKPFEMAPCERYYKDVRCKGGFGK
jgi:hypothetical protein